MIRFCKKEKKKDFFKYVFIKFVFDWWIDSIIFVCVYWKKLSYCINYIEEECYWIFNSNLIICLKSKVKLKLIIWMILIIDMNGGY